MNEIKKIVYLQGTLLAPLAVGSRACISYNGQVIRTSYIVAIHEVNARRVSFETLNSHYCVDLAPVPISAAMPAYTQFMAA